MIRFPCRECYHEISVPDDFADKTVLCPECQAKVKVPVEERADPPLAELVCERAEPRGDSGQKKKKTGQKRPRAHRERRGRSTRGIYFNDLLGDNRRNVGILFLATGIVLVAWQGYAFGSGGFIGEGSVIITPFLLLYGAAVIARPPLLILKGEFHKAPALYKVIYIALFVVGFGIGLYIRFVVFRRWH
jgi:hypothetical protein